jgi:hypothetical protein
LFLLRLDRLRSRWPSRYIVNREWKVKRQEVEVEVSLQLVNSWTRDIEKTAQGEGKGGET